MYVHLFYIIYIIYLQETFKILTKKHHSPISLSRPYAPRWSKVHTWAHVSAEHKQSTVTPTQDYGLNLFRHMAHYKCSCLLTYLLPLPQLLLLWWLWLETVHYQLVCSSYSLQVPVSLVLLLFLCALLITDMAVLNVCFCSSVISIGRTFWIQKSSWHQWWYTVS